MSKQKAPKTNQNSNDMKVSNNQTISSKTNQFWKIAIKIPKTSKTSTRSQTSKENQMKDKKKQSKTKKSNSNDKQK